MGIAKRVVVGAVAAATGVVLVSAPVLADECTNASKKKASAGAQVVFGAGEDPIFATNGVLNRLERGLIDPETGEGYHGVLAFDEDGDGVADASTWINVGPDGAIPDQAQFNGPACKGVTNIGVYFEECVGG